MIKRLIIKFASKTILLVTLETILCLNVNSQNKNLIYNGTFFHNLDSIGDQFRPYGWYVCDAFSDPDIFTSYAGFLPINGSTFIAMRARGVNYLNANNHLRRTREYLLQKLPAPLEKNTCYKFSIFLGYDQQAVFDDSLEPNISHPVGFEFWVGNDSCAHEKRMFVTKAFRNMEWKNFDTTFTTPDTIYSRIRIQVMWDTTGVVDGETRPYNGEMVFDSARLFKSSKPTDTIIADTIYFKGDNINNLVAIKGDFYSWQPKSNLTSNNTQSTTIKEYLNQFIVKINYSGSCPTTEIFNIKLNCDTLHPPQPPKIYYYKYFKNVTLDASDGVTFDWQPQLNLNAYNIQHPYLTGFYDHYEVTIFDKYKCTTSEDFNIYANCDSLLPNKNILVFDTTFNSQPHIILVPKIGKRDGLWSPTNWLSCIDCQTPVASPLTSITYSVNLTDSFLCKHSESFKINLELIIPNVITPNGDGFNDIFKVIGLPEGTSIRIFDKIGGLVFEANPYNETNFWSGKDMNGIPLETGTYWYIISNPEFNLVKKGFIFLVR